MPSAVEETRQQRDAATRQKRLIAWADYQAMPQAERTVDALWKDYCRRKAEGDKTVPTTTRSVLYRWSQEDTWAERLADEEAERQQLVKDETTTIRRRQVRHMTAMLPAANLALMELIEGASDEAVRLRAIQTLLDRIGFPAESRTAAAKRRDEEAAEENAPPSPMSLVPVPGPDATDAEWQHYLGQVAG